MRSFSQFLRESAENYWLGLVMRDGSVVLKQATFGVNDMHVSAFPSQAFRAAARFRFDDGYLDFTVRPLRDEYHAAENALARKGLRVTSSNYKVSQLYSESTILNALHEAKARTFYHATTDAGARSILAHGFDLSRVHPMWPFDYAVSCCESLRDVRAYSGLSKSSDAPILAFTFSGTVASPADVAAAKLGDPLDGQSMTKKTPQQVTALMLRAGLDALRYPYSPASLTNGGQPVIYVYNVAKIADIRRVS